MIDPMPTLYVVATPIGNLEDISLRALRILREVKLIAAEDTRKTKRLLNHYDIHTPMTSYYEYNKLTKLDQVLDSLADGDVALVSDAGTPGISDPGYELVVAAAERGINVVPIPGASSVTIAMSASGLPTDRFTFLGFLPRKSGARRKMLEAEAKNPGSLILLESPHRVVKTLEDAREVFGDRRVAVCRELTKLHEEIFRGTLSEAIERFAETKGEFTLVIEGQTAEEPAEMTDDIEAKIEKMRAAGMTAREAIAGLSAETGLSRKELYRAWLKQD